MKIKWTNIALKALENEGDYIGKNDLVVANEVLQNIKSEVSKLVKMPYLGRIGRVNETRELIIPNLPYLIPYRIKNNNIEILYIFHTSRKWNKKIISNKE